jgi:hypothetical protein
MSDKLPNTELVTCPVCNVRVRAQSRHRHALIDWIRLAFRKLGGSAHLKQVYKEVRRLGYKRGGTDLNKLIRKRIYEHSSDSTPEQFIGRNFFRLRGERGSGVWELRKDGARVNVEDRDLTDDEIDEALRSNRLQLGIVRTGSQEGVERRRRGQDRIRKLTVANYDGRCAVCDVSDFRLLIASHIVPWAKAPEDRGDLSNVICLCRIHDALFETGYWSLGDRFELLKKDAGPSKTIRQLLDGMTSFRVPCIFAPGARFTKWHRERFGLEKTGNVRKPRRTNR